MRVKMVLITGYYGSSGLGGSGLGGGYDRPRGQYGPPQTVDLPGGYYSNDYNGHGNSYGGGGHDIWAEKWQVSTMNFCESIVLHKLYVFSLFFLLPPPTASFQIKSGANCQCSSVGYSRCFSLQSGTIAAGHHFGWQATPPWDQRTERGKPDERREHWNRIERELLSWFGI